MRCETESLIGRNVIEVARFGTLNKCKKSPLQNPTSIYSSELASLSEFLAVKDGLPSNNLVRHSPPGFIRALSSAGQTHGKGLSPTQLVSEGNKGKFADTQL